MNIQITDGVQRALFSVAKITDRGNRVVFGRGGGVIHNLNTDALTPFKRVGGIYALDLWVDVRCRGEGNRGFPRQGR